MKSIDFARPALSALIFVACAQGALALDGQDFGDKFAATLQAAGTEITFASAQADGDTVTVSGVEVARHGEDGAFKVPGDIVFTGVRETGDGGYTADAGRMDDVQIDKDDTTVSVGNIVLNHISVPAAPNDDPVQAMALYRGFSLGPVSVIKHGKEIFNLESVKISNTPNNDLSQFEGAYQITGIHADLSAIDDEDTNALLDQFGVKTLDAHAEGHSRWALDDGQFQITDAALTVDNVGKLSTASDIRGYDRGMLETVHAMQKDMTTASEADEGMSESAKQAMDKILDGLALAGFSLRFDDQGLTDKVLDYFANKQGMPRDVMAAGVSASIPMMLSQTGVSQEFQAMLLNAAQTFLSDPGSLEIKAAPETPVSFADLKQDAADPSTLITRLNVNVIANR